MPAAPPAGITDFVQSPAISGGLNPNEEISEQVLEVRRRCNPNRALADGSRSLDEWAARGISFQSHRNYGTRWAWTE